MKIYLGPYVSSDEETRVEELEFHPYDSWNLDVTLAQIIQPLLLQLRDTTHGYPSLLSNDGEVDTGFDAWKSCLTKMAWSFEQVQTLQDSEETHSRSNDDLQKYYAQIQDGLDLFAKHYLSLWD